MKLTALACKQAKPSEKTRKLTDGQGLYLEVTPTGRKYWRLKYRFLGKEKRLALGIYPEVSLEEAREKRRIARKQIADGKDPAELKKLKKLATQLNYDNSFEAIAREWHENRKDTWSPKHAANLLKRFETDVFPKLGTRPIADIKAPELLAVVRAVENRGAVDVAKRILQTSGQVFRYAVATGRAERDPSVDLKGALKTVKTKNRAYLSEEELPEFLEKLEHYDGHPLTKLAFKFLLLTFVRSMELRGATWNEINWDKPEWRIPAERMKMNEEHIVPLSKQALKILNEIKQHTGDYKHIFANQQNPRKIMSENTLLYALYRMGYHSRATAHGFRSTASTVLNENGFRSDVIEKQLAHGERNQVRAAYNHAEYLSDRRTMMQWWANYLDGKPKAVGVVYPEFRGESKSNG